jgi:hypothetical protein
MSATHSWFGRAAVNLRSTRSAGLPAPSPASVVRLNAPRRTPARPMSRITRATVHLATGRPSRFICRHTLRAP